jgi:hypothetical protein
MKTLRHWKQQLQSWKHKPLVAAGASGLVVVVKLVWVGVAKRWRQQQQQRRHPSQPQLVAAAAAAGRAVGIAVGRRVHLLKWKSLQQQQ